MINPLTTDIRLTSTTDTSHPGIELK